MPENLFIRDFSAGWCPSDDQVDGRANALLQMDNLELDRNGALQLIHGTQIVYSGYPAPAYAMFSRFINGQRYDYVALQNSEVFRNGVPIIGSGDPFNTAFSTAFNYTLICSGNGRYKDDGVTLTNLGVIPPPNPPVVTQSALNAPYAEIGDMRSPIVVVVGTMTVITANYDQCTTDSTGTFVMQSVGGSAQNCTVLSEVGGTGTSTDDDFVIVNGYVINPFGVSLEFDVLLRPGDPAGDPVSDMYTYVVSDISQQANFDTITGVFTIRIPRSSFSRSGAGAYDWSTVYGFRLTIKVPQAAATVINIWGEYMGLSIFQIRGGTSAQFGTYQYAQVNVNNTGSYIAKSVLGPPCNPITLDGVNALITIQNPAAIDPQCNEAWIYRTGGNLGGTWYRVLVVKAPFTSPVYDGMGDQDALELDITININLISTASIPDKIYDIVGPMEGRWFYFTSNFMYPSDINDPDLVDPSISIRICGSASELFMWARPISASVILIGTSINCYLLTGTYSTFPDGTIDVYYQALGVKFPPVTYDAVSYGGAVYYLASDGWRTVLPTSFGTTYSSQNNQLLVSPNTDRLYRGEICYGYAPPTMPLNPGSVRFPVTIAKNKLWCFITGTQRCEVYDFTRQYWRTFNYQLGDAGACTATQDNKLLVFCNGDLILREFDYPITKLIDGVRQQTFNALLTYKDNGKPRQRKDTYTFKTRAYINGGIMFLAITTEQGQAINIPSNLISPSGSTELFTDLSQTLGNVLPKAYQIYLHGTVNDLIVQDLSIDYDARPMPLSFLRIYPTNFGSATQKRLRTWPMIIDTLGNNIVFTPSVDNVIQPSAIFNSNYKKTLFCYFNTDVFGIDYGATLYDPNGLMEVWDTGTGQGGGNLMPDIVQNLPIGHEFDQVGPIEIFRWGKILRMALRVSSQGTPIPFKVYLGDVAVYSGQFDVTPGKEDEYVVDLPKGVSGRILRVELGPCNFVFNRYFMKFQVAMSGTQDDTELKWLTVPGLSSTMAGGI